MKAAGRPYPGDSLNPSSSIPHRGVRFVQIVVCKKCDDIYPICSAASICAKVTRDEETENWNFPEPSLQQTVERNWGSGYPGGTSPKTVVLPKLRSSECAPCSDAKCKEWLMKNYDPVFAFPSFARCPIPSYFLLVAFTSPSWSSLRFSWSTVKDLSEEMNGVKVEWFVSFSFLHHLGCAARSDRAIPPTGRTKTTRTRSSWRSRSCRTRSGSGTGFSTSAKCRW